MTVQGRAWGPSEEEGPGGGEECNDTRGAFSLSLYLSLSLPLLAIQELSKFPGSFIFS